MPKEKLTNAEIWTAQTILPNLLNQKFPVMVSYKLAKLAQKIKEPALVIEETRNALIKKHGKPNDRTGQAEVTQTITETVDGKEVAKPNPAMAAFSEEWAKLLKLEVEVEFDKVKLPDKVASTCDKCHHNMDRPLEIEPGILLALDKFVEVA
jgi:hypothetical protein